MTLPRAAVAPGAGGVRPDPVLSTIVHVLPLWLAWLVVVVLGRLVCRLAQRLPPAVRLVRRLRAGDSRPVSGPGRSVTGPSTPPA
jgi:hypothetical protein